MILFSDLFGVQDASDFKKEDLCIYNWQYAILF